MKILIDRLNMEFNALEYDAHESITSACKPSIIFINNKFNYELYTNLFEIEFMFFYFYMI